MLWHFIGVYIIKRTLHGHLDFLKAHSKFLLVGWTRELRRSSQNSTLAFARPLVLTQSTCGESNGHLALRYEISLLVLKTPCNM